MHTVSAIHREPESLDLPENGESMDLESALQSMGAEGVPSLDLPEELELAASRDLQLEAEERLEALELPPKEPESEEEGLVLPDSAFLDAPERNTRDLLLNALGNAEDGLDPNDDFVPSGSDKPYIFLPKSSDRSERRTSMRFPLALAGRLIRADRRKRQPISVTSGSVDAFFVRAKDPLEQDTLLIAELRIMGGYSIRAPAVVVRTTQNGFAVQLDPEPRTLRFRATFLELAREPTLQNPTIILEVRRTKADPEPTDELTEAHDVGFAWGKVLASPDDDEVNQEFIHTCMRVKNLEFALERYQERLVEGHENAEGYLDQIGTILGFYNMPIKDDIPSAAAGSMNGRVKGWMALVFVVVVAIGAGQYLMRTNEGLKTGEHKPGRELGGGLIHVDWQFGD